MTKSRLHSFYILIVLFILTTVAQGQFMTSVTATSITGTGATITWTTCANSNTTVNYGTTSGGPYGFTATTANSVTSHSQALTGLSGGVKYYFQAVSVDANNAAVSSAEGNFTATATAPVITAQPASFGPACAGDTATFSSTASGVPPPTNQWKYSADSGSTWNNTFGGLGGGTDTFTCTAGNAGCLNGYKYENVYTNTAGSATTNGAAALTVTALPAISNPLSTSVTSGATATFSVTASAGSPTYQWQTDSGTGTFANVASSGTSASYSCTSGTTGCLNGYQYRVIAKNSCNTTGVTSSAATLTVTTGTLYGLSVADASNRTTNVRALNGATLAGNEYIFTSPAGATTSAPSNVDHVDYSLNGTLVGSDYITPFDYNNTSALSAPVNICTPSSNSTTTATCVFPATTTGNTLVIGVVWNTVKNFTSLTSTRDTFTAAAGSCLNSTGADRVQIYYATNITGGSTDTVTFTGSTTGFQEIFGAQYAGIRTTAPIVDKFACGSGTSTSLSSGSITTTEGKELLFGLGISASGITSAGTGWTLRSTLSGDAIQDMQAPTNGVYTATANQGATGSWAMDSVSLIAATTVAPLNTASMTNGTYTLSQKVTKLDGTTETDSATFTVNNTVTAHSVNLSWVAGNAGGFTPVYYHVNRGVAGGAKSVIATIGNGTSTAATTYVDSSSTLTSGTTYNYTIDEVDTRGLKSAASNQVNALIP